ncbi:MAG: C39 family peptidase [Halanaerobiales bacterium]|nr:C39 family peptidase [Halanaerobiales bacterium]
MRKKIKLIIIIFTLLTLISSSTNAGNINFNIISSGIKINRTVKSKTEIRFDNIIKQKYDVSCGSAALATIFNYYYDDKITEQEIIDTIKNFKNISTLENSSGFTLLDLKNAAELYNYNAYGLKGSLNQIKNISLPMIVLLNSPQGPHFVVIKNITDNQVNLADPALGNITLEINEFKEQWNNIVLAIESKTKSGRNNFSKKNTPKVVNPDKLANKLSSTWIETPVNFNEF